MPPKRPPPRKIPSVNRVKDEMQPPTFKPPPPPETPQSSFAHRNVPPEPPDPKLTKQKSGRQHDWFSSTEKKRRNSALGKALLASGLLDKGTSQKISVVSSLREKRSDERVQRAANKWKKTAALKSNGYVVARSPTGDTVQINHELLDNDGFYELKNDCSFQRALPDTDEWIQILSHHARRRTKFVDATFKPNNESLFRDGKKTVANAGLSKIVSKWRRISDIFHQKCVMHLKFTESERTPECYGYETGVEKMAPMILNQNLNVNGKNSLKMAKMFVEKVLCETDPDERKNIILQYGGPMGGSMLKRNVFQNIAENHLPMQFTHISDDETYVVDRQVRDGYVTMIRIQVTLCFDPPRGIHLFDIHEHGNMVGAGDVCQGQLGDCYLMGALSVISRVPSQLMSIFPSCKQEVLMKHKHQPPQEYNNAGVYAVKFWRGNAWRIVVVDDYIPCGGDGLPCFASLSEGSCEFWPLIVEKAYAKLNGSYEAIISGKENQALQDLTGGVPIMIKIGDKLQDKYKGAEGTKMLWAYLNERMDEGSHIGISKSKNGLPGRSPEIQAQHAYGITKLSLLNDQTPVVQIRNPWGKGMEWRGKFSDSDPIWGTLSNNVKKQLGYTQNKDGTWWMSFQDLLREFDELSICRMMDGFQVHHIVGHWKGNTASGRNAPHLAPQFHLHAEEGENGASKIHVVVELRQPSHRDLGANVYEALTPVIAGNADRHSNIYLEPRMSKGPFLHSRSAVVEIDCLKSDLPLSISPVTWNEGYESMFYIDVYTDCKSKVIACNDCDLPRDPTTGELLKGSIVSYENKGKKIFLLEKNKQKYLKSSADICKHCNKPIMPTKGTILGTGKFSGRYYTLDNGDKIHAECWDNYNKKNADKCLYCKAPIMAIKGKFSGAFYKIKDDDSGGGKVHDECMTKYELKKAPRCFRCKKPIVAGGIFSGSYYDIEGKGKIHKECYDKV